MGATLLDQPGRPLTEAEIALSGDRRYTRGPKNYLLNGAMMVSQENPLTSGTINGFYAVDQFASEFTHGGTTTLVQVASTSPTGSPNRLRVTATAADASVAAGDFLQILQRIEGLRVVDLLFGTSAAKTITVRFGVKAPAGTYCVMVTNSALNRRYIAEYTITAGEANTDVMKSVTIPGDTSGTWLKDTGTGLVVYWNLMCGTTFQAAAGSWVTSGLASASQFNLMGTINNVFELFDVSLVEGAYAPSFVVPDYISELELCKRYYQKWSYIVMASGAQEGLILPTALRATPVITGGGAGFGSTGFTDGQSGSVAQTTRATQTLVFNARL